MPRRIEVEIIGDSRSLERAFARSEKSAKGFGRSMERFGRGSVVATVGFRGLGRAVGYASAAFLGGAGFAAAAKAGFNELFEGQKVLAQTNAVLKSTGRIAGVTAGEISGLASSLQKLTGYDDEAIQSAENLLLTFTNIRNVAGKNNDIFNQATLATLNLSRTFGQDLSSSAVQLGKALQDPVRGVTALRRVGVSFTKAQQDLIKRLVETGDTLGAQKVILQELNRETGKSAEAYGKTLPGQLDILQGNLENLAGELARTLNPEVKRLTDRFNKWLEDPEHKKEIIDGFAAGVHALGVAARMAADTVGALKSAWDALPDFGKHKGLLDLIPGGNISLLDLFRRGGGGKQAAAGPWGTNLFGMPAAAIANPDLYFFQRPRRGAARPGGVEIPGSVSGTVATPGLRAAGIPRGVTGSFQFLRASYEAPIQLQLAQAQAAAQGRSLVPILRRMRDAARRALKSGRLSLEAQIDAWDDIASLNEQLKDTAKTARDTYRQQRARAVALARAQGAEYQFAQARGGPTIHIEHFYSAAANPRALENELVKRARARAHVRRGAR